MKVFTAIGLIVAWLALGYAGLRLERLGGEVLHCDAARYGFSLWWTVGGPVNAIAGIILTETISVPKWRVTCERL